MMVPMASHRRRTTDDRRPYATSAGGDEKFREKSWYWISSVGSTFSKAATTSGSNCIPAHRRISATAVSQGRPLRYARWEVIASRVSATASTLAGSGMSAPASLSG